MNKADEALFRARRERARKLFARFAFKEASAPEAFKNVDYYFRVLPLRPPTALRAYVSQDDGKIRLNYEGPVGNPETLCNTWDTVEVENVLTKRFRPRFPRLGGPIEEIEPTRKTPLRNSPQKELKAKATHRSKKP